MRKLPYDILLFNPILEPVSVIEKYTLALPFKLGAVLNDNDVLPLINNSGENVGSIVNNAALSILYILAFRLSASTSGKFRAVIIFANVNVELLKESSSTVRVHRLFTKLK